jgi:hypothetical protein
MMHTSKQALLAIHSNLQADLDRLKKLIEGVEDAEEEEDALLHPRDPRNKTGLNLTPRGAEVCYRFFDQAKTPYAVGNLLDISFGAAKYRFEKWLKAGGKNRVKQPLR